MLTLQELKEITETTKHGIKMPTARKLREIEGNGQGSGGKIA